MIPCVRDVSSQPTERRDVILHGNNIRLDCTRSTVVSAGVEAGRGVNSSHRDDREGQLHGGVIMLTPALFSVQSMEISHPRLVSRAKALLLGFR